MCTGKEACLKLMPKRPAMAALGFSYDRYHEEKPAAGDGRRDLP